MTWTLKKMEVLELFLSNEFLKSKSELSPDDINEGFGSACAEGQIEVFSRANPDKSYLDAIVSVFEIDPAAAKELKKEKSKELFLSRVYNFKEDDEGTQSAVDPLFKVGEVHPYGVLYLLENIGVVTYWRSYDTPFFRSKPFFGALNHRPLELKRNYIMY